MAAYNVFITFARRLHGFLNVRRRVRRRQEARFELRWRQVIPTGRATMAERCGDRARFTFASVAIARRSVITWRIAVRSGFLSTRNRRTLRKPCSGGESDEDVVRRPLELCGVLGIDHGRSEWASPSAMSGE